MTTHHLAAPLDDEQIRCLRVGDTVTVSGLAFTCRSRLQRYVFDEKHALPDDLKEYDILIHAGPIVLVRPEGFQLVSFMPTSSVRFEKWGAQSVRDWGLKLVIGKTTMGVGTMAEMGRSCCVHLSPRSVSPNLWCDQITVIGVKLYDEMGSIEAPWQFKLDRLGPFVVDIDTHGDNLFDRLDEQVKRRQKDVYRRLGIPDDFKETRLY